MSEIPLLLLPGILNDGRLWEAQVAAFSASRSIMIGCLTGQDSIAALARDVLAQAPAGRFALAGFSLGGYTALEIMRQAPERVAGLAMIDSSARADTPESMERRRAMMAQAAEDFEGVRQAFAERLVHPRRLADAELMGKMAAMGRAVGREGFLRQQMAAMGRMDSRPFLKDIRCPALVICGRQDAVTPLEMAEEMAAGIEGARLVVVEESGHMSPMERPAAVTDAMREWLARI